MELLIDNIDSQQKLWLAHLVRNTNKGLNSFVPLGVFAVFRARGWVEGDAAACKLTADGNGAAMRIFGSDMGQDKVTKKAKRKHSVIGK